MKCERTAHLHNNALACAVAPDIDIQTQRIRWKNTPLLIFAHVVLLWYIFAHLKFCNHLCKCLGYTVRLLGTTAQIFVHSIWAPTHLIT